jgi:hypothetical protein
MSRRSSLSTHPGLGTGELIVGWLPATGASLLSAPPDCWNLLLGVYERKPRLLQQ